jgi:L-fuconolactonase
VTGLLDAHVHVWDLARCDYPWLTETWQPIRRTLALADCRGDLSDAGVRGVILVQAADDPGDTEVMLAASAESSEVAGVIAWIDLEAPDAGNAADRLAARGPIVGFRHLIHDEPDADWIMRPAVLAGLAEVGQRRLAFDVHAVVPRHLEHLISIARRLPDLQLVLDHLAKPPLGRDLGDWRRLVERAAEAPNVSVKISGTGSLGEAGTWAKGDLAEAFEVLLEAFGPERLMYGSDWPVCLTAGGYAHQLGVFRELVARLSPDEQAAMGSGTARRVYRVRAVDT